jgi:hypothetical protein
LFINEKLKESPNTFGQFLKEHCYLA